MQRVPLEQKKTFHEILISRDSQKGAMTISNTKPKIQSAQICGRHSCDNFSPRKCYNSEILNVQLKSLMANARGVGFPVQEHCVRPFPCGAIK